MSPAAYRYVVCDVFTDRPLHGNQLAVFTDARGLPEELLQPLAREVNFSETVFCYPATDGGHARLRIFTPIAELRFAGHPILGTAFVLAGPLQLAELHLETAVGTIPVRLEREGARIAFGRMVQPLPTVEPFAHEEELRAALGIAGSELPVELYDNGIRHVFFCLRGAGEVAAVAPDLARVARIPGLDGASCFARDGSRWKTRMFAPADGVPEDPATGSAAGPLAAHLVRHGLVPPGEEIVIGQGTEVGRPATLYARADGTRERVERVEVGGEAVIVGRGEYRL